MLEEFGPERIRDTPLSELGFVGAGIGAALGGMRPIVEVMTVNFSLLALDQIVNTAALVPAHVGRAVQRAARDPHGDRRRPPARGAALAQPRGLVRAHARASRSLAPATVEDARGMLGAGAGRSRPGGHLRARAALQHRGRADRCGAARRHPRGAVLRRRPRRHARSPTAARLRKALEAAEALAGEGIDAEVVDLRVLRPLDDATIVASVRTTRRAVVVDEGWRTRQPRGRDHGAHRGAGVLRPRRAGRRACAARRCRSPTRSTSRRRRCRRRRRSSPPCAGCSARRERDDRVQAALARRRHGRGHAGRVEGEARRRGEAGRRRRGGRHQQGGDRGRDLGGREPSGSSCTSRRKRCRWAP